MGFVVNGKSLMQVAVFAIAGALGGGGVSFAATPKDELSALRTIIETVALSVNEIKVDMRHSDKERGDIRAMLKDHEDRIRAQESCVCKER